MPMLTRIFSLLLLMVAVVTGGTQPVVQPLSTDHRSSLRGLSVPDDRTAWASGSGGAVARTTDGGRTWRWIKVPGYERRDFRDIEAFDSATAIIMAVDGPGVILKTTDGGISWRKVFEDSTAGIFLDAMAFKGQTGVVIGDPINGELYLRYTTDGGDNWVTRKPGGNPVKPVKGEALFASSGTNIAFGMDVRDIFFVTGGTRSGFYVENRSSFKLPLVQGQESTGANSLAISGMNMIVVGGDFAHDTDSTGNCAVSADYGGSWHTPQQPPHGYRSCVIYTDARNLVSCGTSGIDISADGGNTWQLVSREGFHVCQKAKKGTAVYLAGSGGRISRLNFQ